MPYFSKQELIELTKNLGIHLSKERGQCFLIDRNIKDKIIQTANLNAQDDIVLEIGPGLGVLSDDLAQNSKQLFLIELDKKPVDFLYEHFKSNQNVTLYEKFNKNMKDTTKIGIIHSNVLKTEWPRVNKIVSNIPYQISGPLLFKILNNWSYESVILLVQQEFAERLVAKANSSKYSRLSAGIGLFLDVNIISNVSRNCFFPIPRVTSAIIKISSKTSFKNKEYSKEDKDLYLKFLEGIFPYKNKAIRKAIIHFFDKFEKFQSSLSYLYEYVQPSLYSGLLKRKVRSFSPEELYSLILFGKQGDFSILSKIHDY